MPFWLLSAAAKMNLRYVNVSGAALGIEIEGAHNLPHNLFKPFPFFKKSISTNFTEKVGRKVEKSVVF